MSFANGGAHWPGGGCTVGGVETNWKAKVDQDQVEHHMEQFGLDSGGMEPTGAILVSSTAFHGAVFQACSVSGI